MKKKTVITTEKHEVWVIRQAAEKPAAKGQTPDTADGGTESLVPTAHEDPDKPPTQEKEKGQ